jgi:hypothetical protein
LVLDRNTGFAGGVWRDLRLDAVDDARAAELRGRRLRRRQQLRWD